MGFRPPHFALPSKRQIVKNISGYILREKVTAHRSIYPVSWETEIVPAQVCVLVFFLKAKKDWLEQAKWMLRLPAPVEFP